MSRYYGNIVEMLSGKTDELAPYHKRLDWQGFGAVLDLYNTASGADRDEIIQAMGEIIESGIESPPILAQVVQLASSLNVTQVEPSVRKLQEAPVAADEAVREAVTSYLARRELVRHRIR